MRFSMEKQIQNFWIAGFFLPTINATVFSVRSIDWNRNAENSDQQLFSISIYFQVFWWPRVKWKITILILEFIKEINTNQILLIPSDP